MSKVDALRKTLIATSIFSFILTASAIGSAAGFFLFSRSIDAENIQMERNSRKYLSEFKILSRKHKKAQASLDLFKKLTETSTSDSATLDRKRAASILDELHKHYLLSDLTLSISPIQERKGKEFQRNSGTIISSNVEIHFQSITDEFSYAFLNELTHKFPGYINLTSFELSRTHPSPTNNIDKPPTFVKASIGFDWLGLRINDNKTKK